MKTALITGATDGIGRETARQLLALGFRVLAHGRTPEKARHTAEDLAQLHPAGEVRAIALKFSV